MARVAEGTIDLGDMDVHISIPMVTKAGRGTPFTYALSYDSDIWAQGKNSGGSTAWVPSPTWGWTAESDALVGYVTYEATTGMCEYQTSPVEYNRWNIYSNFTYVDSSGQPHDFGGQLFYPATPPQGECGPTSPTTLTVGATDGSGLALTVTENSGGTISASVATPAGGTFYPPSFVQGNVLASGSGSYADSDGNEISTDGTTFTDTLGETALSISGSGTPSSPVLYTIASPGNGSPDGTETVTVSYTDFTVSTSFGTAGVAEYPATTVALPTEVLLPDGTHYQFSYDGAGRIASITLPTGGQITYTYSTAVNSDGSPQGITRVTPDGTWTYSHVLDGTGRSTTNVTDPEGNVTEYVFYGGLEVERMIYQGANTGTLLETVDTCYNGGAGPNNSTGNCISTGGTGAFVAPVASSSVITTLSPATADMVSETDIFLDAVGDPTEVDQYDWGAGSRGGLLRKTLITYAGGSEPADRPSQVVVQDGSGNTVARTNYDYDQGTPAATSGLPQHQSGVFSGNVTEVDRYSSASSVVKTTFTYFDDGEVASETNPLGGVTAFTYGTGSCGGAFPTSVTFPKDAQGTSYSAQYSWDCGGGVPVSVTGPNGKKTSFQYDAMWRRNKVTYPDGSAVDTTYSIGGGSNTVTTSGSAAVQTVVTLDSLGRPVSRAVADGSNYDRGDTCYNQDGLVSFTSNPYSTTSDSGVPSCSSESGSSFTYDALGRETSVTPMDGSTAENAANATYVGRAEDVTDEGNGGYAVEHVYQRNALGELTSVCEVDAQSQAGSFGAPAACGQDIAKNGFLTTYSYDARGDLVGVSRNAQAGGTQQDWNFSFDWLGRMTSKTTPQQTAATDYYYDSDASCAAPNAFPGQLAAEQDARGVLTCYQYDALGRVTQISFSDGSTPTDKFTYDVSSFDNQSISDPLGRLVAATTSNTAVVNSFDDMGRVTTQWQCTPSNCPNGSFYTMSYAYDALGDITSEAPGPVAGGSALTFTRSFDADGRLTGIASSFADSNHPGTLLSSATYTPFGGLAGADYGDSSAAGSETLNYNWDDQLTSMSVTGSSVPARGSITISGTEQSKNGTPATAGTGSVTIGGSEQSIAATSGTASVTITGSEQSGSTTATHATGSVSISGSEQSYNYCYNAGPGGEQCQEMYQGGGVYVTINGVTEQGDYSQGSTADSVASALASAFNANDSGEISASAGGGTVYFTTVATGTAANYSMSTSDQYSTQYWTSPSFTGYPSGGTLTGGSNASTYYDSGTVSIAVNGQTFTAPYGQGSTTASIASALASAIAAGSSYASASVSGSTIILTAKTTGSGTNYALSTSSATGDSSQFSSPSFGASPSGSAFTGGQNTIYDSGTVTITVNGFAESVSYGNGSTAGSLASALASGFSGASGSPVSAAASGGTVDLTSKTTGSSTNYSLSASSATGDSGQFSSPSFSTSPSGSSLTGGTAGTATTYDSGTVWAQVGSFKATVNYGQSDTDSSIAANLASALSASGSPVTATASGSTVSITTTATGSGADTSFTAGSSTSDGTDFSSASFSAGPTSGSLTGGGTGSYSLAGLTYAPDGQILTADDSINGNWAFTYDPLNRLATATCSANCPDGQNTEGISESYDIFGDRWDQTVTAGSATTEQYSFTSAGQVSGGSYDPDGDLLAANSHSFTYDGENRVVAVDGGNTASYVYNALGERVEATVGGVTRDYLYDLAGRPVTELDTQGNWERSEVYADGAVIATYANNTVYFDRSNWLGTVRQRATMSGGPYETCTSLPYGDALACAGADPSPLHFTGQPRDTESGLDAFPLRYYNSGLAGWMTPDPAGLAAVNPMNPQSWDPYAYVGDNPMNATDPLGLNGNGSTGCGVGQPADGPCPSGPINVGLVWSVTWSYCVTCDPGPPPGWVNANVAGEPYCAANPLLCMGPLPHANGPGGGGGGGGTAGSPSASNMVRKTCARSGNAPPPSFYLQKGLLANALEASGGLPMGILTAVGGAALNAYNILSFRGGGPLDAQALGASPAYANYVYGVYFEASGFSLSTALRGANAYAAFRKWEYPQQYDNRVMSDRYPALPAANVTDIIEGYNDARGGALCSVQ